MKEKNVPPPSVVVVASILILCSLPRNVALAIHRTPNDYFHFVSLFFYWFSKWNIRIFALAFVCDPFPRWLSSSSSSKSFLPAIVYRMSHIKELRARAEIFCWLFGGDTRSQSRSRGTQTQSISQAIKPFEFYVKCRSNCCRIGCCLEHSRRTMNRTQSPILIYFRIN